MAPRISAVAACWSRAWRRARSGAAAPGPSRVTRAEQEDGAGGEGQAEREQEDDARVLARPAAFGEERQHERPAGEGDARRQASPQAGSGESGGRRLHAPPPGRRATVVARPRFDRPFPRPGSPGRARPGRRKGQSRAIIAPRPRVDPDHVELGPLTGVDFESAWRSRVVHRVGLLEVPFLDRETLIRNKRATGRLQDLADVERLEGERGVRRSCVGGDQTRSASEPSPGPEKAPLTGDTRPTKVLGTMHPGVAGVPRPAGSAGGRGAGGAPVPRRDPDPRNDDRT